MGTFIPEAQATPPLTCMPQTCCTTVRSLAPGYCCLGMTYTVLHHALIQQDVTQQTRTKPPAFDGIRVHGLKASPTAVTEQASSMPTAFANACIAQHAAAAVSDTTCTCHNTCWQSAPLSFGLLKDSKRHKPPQGSFHTDQSLQHCHSASWFYGPHKTQGRVGSRMHAQHAQGHQLAPLSSCAAAASAPGRRGFRQRRGSMSAPSALAGAFTVPRHCAVPQWQASSSSPQNLRAGRSSVSATWKQAVPQVPLQSPSPLLLLWTASF